MTKIGKAWNWLFSRTDKPMSARDVIDWWEIRRIHYNIIVGAYGIVCLVIVFVLIVSSGELKPGEDAVEPMTLMMAPLFVNFFYTGGWVIELLARAVRLHHRKLGPVLWATGTVFSLIVCSLPPFVWAVVCLTKVLRVHWPR